MCEACSQNTCAKCRAVYYCSRECQAIHWSEHRLVCRPVTDIINALHHKLSISAVSFAKKFNADGVNIHFSVPYATYVANSRFCFAEISSSKIPSAEGIRAAYVFSDVEFVRSLDKKIQGCEITCGDPWTILVES